MATHRAPVSTRTRASRRARGSNSLTHASQPQAFEVAQVNSLGSASYARYPLRKKRTDVELARLLGNVGRRLLPGTVLTQGATITDQKALARRPLIPLQPPVQPSQVQLVEVASGSEQVAA